MDGTIKINTKKYNLIDVVKFILAILIMIIHSGIDKTVISPILRVAVPLFFIISAYFFFRKLTKIEDNIERRKALFHFVKRNLFLYIIWAIIQLPLIIYFRDYYLNFFPNGILSVFKDFLQGSMFTGSWFIVALVLAVIVVYFASKKIPAWLILLLTVPIYVLCCFSSNYFGLLPETSFLVSFFKGYESVFGVAFYTSLPAAFFWVAAGNFFAKNEFSFKKFYLYIAFALSAICIAVERYFIVRYNLQNADDCYFSLMLLCPLLFLIILKHNGSINSTFRFRELSTIIYVAHGSVERMVEFVLKKFMTENNVTNSLKVVISFCLILAVGYLIILLRTKVRLKPLKYIC